MVLHSLRILAVGLAPIVLSACVEIEPAIGSPTPSTPLVGIDLGSSGRLPQIAAVAGEGEGYGRTEPNPFARGRGSTMQVMTHGAMGNGAMPGVSHGTTDHAAMPGMSHGSMDHGSISGMGRPAQAKMATVHSAMPGMRHGSGGGEMRMAHSGHTYVQGSGAVNSVDVAAHKVNVSHGPIPGIGWPAMTMDFAVAPSVELGALKPGMRVNFQMEQGQYGMYVIQSITSTGRGK